jgi:phage-related protein
MTLATFSPAITPGINSEKDIQANVLRCDFGDGYTQRCNVGLNNYKRMITLIWGALTLANANYIEEFLQTSLWELPFYYQMPDESTTRKWIADPQSYQRTYNDGVGFYTIQVKFEEVFDTLS